MSERPVRQLVGRSAAPGAALSGLLVVIWAVSGGGYFWPMWPCFGALFLVGLVSSAEGAERLTGRRHDRLAEHAVLSGVVFAATVAIWLMAGLGYFWPIWPLLGLAALWGLHWMIERPRDHSLEVRVDELTRTRSGALDVQASELRRIERDLHDGAQARLVALSLQLGRAEERLADNPETAALVRKAKQEATAAIAELRDLARGISPPVLADRGLEAAVTSLADRAGAQVSVSADIPRRPAPAVENAAYFVVAEALTNASKHAPGASVRVTMWAEHGELGIVVADEPKPATVG